MELKLEIHRKISNHTHSSNCTLVELKLGNAVGMLQSFCGSNCTLVELKHQKLGEVVASVRVLIVP